MREYYDKVLAGFEFCKRTLEQEMDNIQLANCFALLNNYGKLCDYYINVVKSETGKKNAKYLHDVALNKFEELKSILDELYNEAEAIAEQERNDSKIQRETLIQLDTQNSYISTKFKKPITVKGFAVKKKRNKS